MTKFIFLLLMCVDQYANAGPYYEVKNSTTLGTSSMTISGYIGVAASSTTPTAYKIRLDGVAGYVQFPDGTKQTTAYSSNTASGYAVLNATQSFTGQNTFSSVASTTTISTAFTTNGNLYRGNDLAYMVIAGGVCLGATSVSDAYQVVYGGASCSGTNTQTLNCPSGSTKWITSYFINTGFGGEGGVCVK
jgi:hypothetical protein